MVGRKMTLSMRQYKEKINNELRFCKEYLVTCITAGHTEDEIIEYCERLQRAIKESQLIERMEDRK